MDLEQLPTVFDPIEIKLEFQDFVDQFPEASRSDNFLENAAIIFDQEKHNLRPKAVLRLMRVAKLSEGEVHLFTPDNQSTIKLELGYSSQFLNDAKIVITGVYTSGSSLKETAIKASIEKRYLDTYILDQMAMLVLGKTGAAVNSIIEKIAKKHSMGVSPILSPGSVHGWELSDQVRLCSLLPLDEIGLRCLDNGVLQPFNSLSFLIGIGSKYQKSKIDSPCEVCSRRERCELRGTSYGS